MNDSSRVYTWAGGGDGTYLATGNASNTYFVANIRGWYNVGVLLHCTNGTANDRSMIYARIHKLTASGAGTNPMTPIGSSYYRDDNNAFDDIVIAGSCMVHLEVGEQWAIQTIRVFSQDGNDDNPASQTGSRLYCEYVGL